MEHILIAYASVTGNTETVALFMEQYIQKHFPKIHVSVKSVQELRPEVLKTYQKVVFGSSTWDDGQLNMFAVEFFEDMESKAIDLSGVSVGVFALGETYYPNFATSADIAHSKFKSHGAQVYENLLKLDGYPDESNLQKVEDWIDAILSD